ncbi:putative unusual protein kinase regulating ubiquinone biosynthesis (AarF/ABC1/UbiB family) [Psychrobacter sp. PL15]|jgi:predicted unusual protein kinase regulating ubiquinone biosynthesis (AarF/ABC1/UbiB family)|uniref:ABC1 kinase family protein n=1 Tax=Psychrobacter sp. PL15 TaxID=3071719 RepID=UPI002E0654DE|nr:putative unusual protein kinase regulating ubiquinone biosynthesis (AarF/ABC1/UbiB family) [Psychrobacter sp. PL15]
MKTHRPHLLKHTFNIVNRVCQTASIAGLSALRVAKGEKPDAKLLKETFEQLGTTYIKIGQFIASTPSLFPREYVEAFQGCLDQTTPLSYDYIERVLTNELATHGQTLSDKFAHIDKKPLASASIAQVHAARLYNGDEVVIKVQKPGVEIIMQTDLGVLHAVTKLLELLMPSMKFASIAPIIDEIRLRMLAETDFIAEAKNIRDFQQFLTVSGNTRVIAPEVYDELTTKRILTMSRLRGVSMVDEAAMRQYCDDPAQVMADTLNTWFASLMLCNSFHADLHAGNLMLLTDGRIGFLDFGIVGKLKAESWRACIGMMQALQDNDYQAMAHHMIDMEMTHGRHDVNAVDLANDLQRMMRSIVAEDVTFTSGVPFNTKEQANELNKMMLEIVDVGKRHGIHFPRDFALLTKQLLYFDRFMRTLAPDMDMFSDKRVAMLGQN